ncbi:lysophospholipid acyltransferase family protein [Thiolapillus sp.]
MMLFRVIWRFILLLLHTLGGIWLSLRIHKRKAPDGVSYPDPQPVANWSARLLKILGVEVVVHGKIPGETGLVVANHVSWLDIPVINSLTGAAFLSKNSIRYWPVIGWFAIASGTLFIRRGNHEAKRISAAIATRLNEDRRMAIFPEGTTSDGRKVRRFFPRLFSAAIDTGKPVIPVALCYRVSGQPDTLVPYTPGRSFFYILVGILARRKSEVHVCFSSILTSTEYDRKGLAEASRNIIQAALEDPSLT